MVSAESKKDRRTVEDIQAELRAKKRQRLEQGATAAAPEGEDDDGDKDERKVAKIV